MSLMVRGGAFAKESTAPAFKETTCRASTALAKTSCPAPPERSLCANDAAHFASRGSHRARTYERRHCEFLQKEPFAPDAADEEAEVLNEREAPSGELRAVALEELLALGHMVGLQVVQKDPQAVLA